MPKNISLARLRFADYLLPQDVIGWPQGPGEPLALTEALVSQRSFPIAQRCSSGPARCAFAAGISRFARSTRGTNRRVTALADMFRVVSSIPHCCEPEDCVDVVLVQVKPLLMGFYARRHLRRHAVAHEACVLCYRGREAGSLCDRWLCMR
jgi:acetyl-CoA hydrolase